MIDVIILGIFFGHIHKIKTCSSTTLQKKIHENVLFMLKFCSTKIMNSKKSVRHKKNYYSHTQN